MDSQLINQIKDKIFATGAELVPPASEDAICLTETELGFRMPDLLRNCLMNVANGGFGPGYGFVGVANGYESDFGSLFKTYKQIRGDQELVGCQWPSQLLPFCEWGNAIFSCVDCSSLEIWTFRDFELKRMNYSFSEFIERWLSGETSQLVESGGRRRSVTIRNPFTGDDTIVSES